MLPLNTTNPGVPTDKGEFAEQSKSTVVIAPNTDYNKSQHTQEIYVASNV